MAKTYLDLCNTVCAEINEVPMTSANFDMANGIYTVIKNGVNRAIKDINSKEFFWRFNFRQKAYLLEEGKTRIPYPAEAKVIDFDSFRIGVNVTTTLAGAADWEDALVWSDADTYTSIRTFVDDKELTLQTQWLKKINYDDYLQNYAKNEFDPSTNNVPYFVSTSPSAEAIIYPRADKSYPLFFDYYISPDDLVNYDDETNIPDRYDFVIFTGAMRSIAAFREDDFNTERYEILFRDQIKDMRLKEVNLYDYVRNGVIVR